MFDDQGQADARAPRTRDRDCRTARNHLHAAERRGPHPLDAGQLWSFMDDDNDGTHPLVGMAGRAPPVRVDTPVRRRQRPDGPAGQPALPDRAKADRAPRPLPQPLHLAEPPPRTTGCWTRPGGAATGSRGPCGCSVACGRPPSGSCAPWSGRPPSANQPSRGTATRGPERPSPTRRPGSSAAGSAAGRPTWSTRG